MKEYFVSMKTKTNNIMTQQHATSLLIQATTVDNWNSIRQTIKDSCNSKEWLQMIRTVDCSGLIVKVLGPDPRYYRTNKQA
jgi:hypothetical protein